MNALRLTIDQLVISGTTALPVEPEQLQEMLAAEVRRELPRLLAERGVAAGGAITRMDISSTEISGDALVNTQELARAIARRIAALAVRAAGEAGTGQGMEQRT